MEKRGQIWISAVLYIALGVIVVTIILSAGVPLIQKMRDRNVVTQTKNIFFVVDESMVAVMNEGPGARRVFAPFEIRAGDFYVEDRTNRILWNYTSTAKLLEPGITLKEGAVNLRNYETLVEEEFIMNLMLNYTDVANLSLKSDFQGPFTGLYSLTIYHTGDYTDNKPVIEINIKG